MSTITRPTILDRTLRSRYVGQSRLNSYGLPNWLMLAPASEQGVP